MSSYPNDNNNNSYDQQPGENSNDASFPHDYHDQYENGYYDDENDHDDQYQNNNNTHQQPAGVQEVNFLLETLSMKAERPVLRLSQLSSSFFVLAFRQLFGEVPEGVNISPQSIEDRIQNARAVIESIESKVDMSLAHISPELVATHDEANISKLLRVFVDIVTAPDAVMDGEGDDYYEDGTGDGDQLTDVAENHNNNNSQSHQSQNQNHQHSRNNQQQHRMGSSIQANPSIQGNSKNNNNLQQQLQNANTFQQQQQQQQQQQNNNKNNASTTTPSHNVNQVTRVRDWLTSMYSNQQHNSQQNHQQHQHNNNINNEDHPLYQQSYLNNNNNSTDENFGPGDSFQRDQQNNNNNNMYSSTSAQQQQQQMHSDPNGMMNLNSNNINNNNNGSNTNFSQQGGSGSNLHMKQQNQNQQSGNNNNNNNNSSDKQQQQIERRVRRVADFIGGSNVPRYQTHVCGRLTDGDGRYIRHFTGDGPLSTIGVATAQKKSTTSGTSSSMANRPLPAMSNARRDAKIERLRSEKFLQDAQDRAVREVVRQASREEVRMVQELKQQLREQRETFLSLDKLAKEKDHRLRQIYSDNVVSAVGATRNKNIKLNLHKNAADLVKRERAVVDREKQECEAEIRLQFEVLRAKREAYLSHLSSWRVAVMKQSPTKSTGSPTSGFAAAAPVQQQQQTTPAAAAAGNNTSSSARQQQQAAATSSRRPSSSGGVGTSSPAVAAPVM